MLLISIQNENVRVAFCENQNWLPVASLLGLVSCAVPPSLKGLLMQTLASFAKSPEIASSLWVSLEASQVQRLFLFFSLCSNVPVSLFHH